MKIFEDTETFLKKYKVPALIKPGVDKEALQKRVLHLYEEMHELENATEDDDLKNKENIFKQIEAKTICNEKIIKHQLNMKLINVEYTFDNNKVIFYFTSDGRVDFRELVKDLAAVFRTRIELRQIGVRDEAKFVSGIGQCGLPLCCSTWLGDFQPVSIKMAKDQNLSLSPAKISGICGRLMCCLKYEHETYISLKKELPTVGEFVRTEKGNGKVIDIDVLKQKVRVFIKTKEDKDENITIWYDNSQIIKNSNKKTSN